jgi:hypothetical protein
VTYVARLWGVWVVFRQLGRVEDPERDHLICGYTDEEQARELSQALNAREVVGPCRS